MSDLAVNNLSIGYNKLTLIENVNLNLSFGDTIGIIGKNGSGKSTFLKSLFNLKLIKSGSIFLADENLRNIESAEFSKIFSYVSQELFFPDYLTTKEFLKLNSPNLNNREDEYLSEFNAKQFINLEVSKLSGGEKRKIAICAALYKYPKILLLDEPETHLDPVETNLIIELIKKITKKNKLITFIVSHRLDVLDKICTKYLVLKNSNFTKYNNVNEFNLKECYE